MKTKPENTVKIDGTAYPVLNIENVTKQVAEMCPVTDAQRQRSREVERGNLRNELEKIEHLIESHRESLAFCREKQEEINSKIAAKQTALDKIPDYMPGVRSRRAELQDGINGLATEYEWFKQQAEKYAKLLEANQARLKDFPHQELREYEQREKALASASRRNTAF